MAQAVMAGAVIARAVMGGAAMMAAVALAGRAEAQQSPPAPAAPGIPVTLAAAARQDVPILLRNIGAVQAYQTVLMRSRIDGTLEQVFFQEGQEVKRGDKLAQIDPRPYQAVLDQALAKKAQDEVQLANAQLDLNRSTELARNQYAAQQTVDTRRAAVRALEAQIKADEATVAAARVNLDYTTITAPFDGRVGLRQLDPGNVVRAADPAGVGIVTISQIRPIAVLFNLPQDALPTIQASMAKGTLTVFAYASDDQTLLATGELMTVDNAIDTATGTIRMKARFSNADSHLWPGQFVNVRLQTEVRKNVVTIPSIAVLRGPADLFVYVARPDNTVAVTPVTLGQDDGHIAIVTSGLQDGQLVVVSGMSRLQNGARIAPAPPKSAS
jgi:multidrug efflux system membrane fusion protein